MKSLGVDRPVSDRDRVYRTSRVLKLEGGVELPICVGTTGERILGADIALASVKMIHAGTFFKFRGKFMSDKAAEATAIIDSSIETFSKSLTRFNALQDGFSDKCKRASGNVRDAAEKLGQGMARVEKAANFDRLERYVVLLERAAAAMTTLAELESSGKLDKIANAVR